MAVTVSYFNKFMESVGKNQINLDTDTFRVILVNNYSFDPTDELLADIGAVEIAEGNGYLTNGNALTGVTFGWTGTTTRWDAEDTDWTASGGTIGPTDGAIIYDDSSTGDKLVCYIDFGQEESAGDDTDFKITFNANGIFVIN